MRSGGGAEGGPGMMALAPLWRDRDQSCFPSLSPPAHSTMWRYNKKATICKPEEGSHQEPDHAVTLIVDFQTPELWEISVCCLNHPVCDLLLQQPELIKTDAKQDSPHLPTASD